MNKWFEYRIYASREDEDNIIRNFIQPLISFCDEQDGFESFHFLRENGDPHILFRVYGEEELLENTILPRMLESAENMSLDGRLNPIGNYEGESDSYGSDGWDIAYRFFEVASRARAWCPYEQAQYDKVQYM